MKLAALAGRDYPSQPFLYHGGMSQDVDSILKRGLLANPDRRTWEDTIPGAVYLTDTLSGAVKWVKHAIEYNPELGDLGRIVLYKVDVSKLKPELFQVDHIGVNGDWRYRGNIPPESIELI